MRELQTYRRPSDKIVTINTDARSKREYEKAKKEATKAAGQHLRLNKGIVEQQLRLRPQYIMGGERDITSNIWPEVDICLSKSGLLPDPESPERDLIHHLPILHGW